MADRLDLLIVFPNNRVRSYGSLGLEITAVTPPQQCGLTAAYVRQKGVSVRILDCDAKNLSPDQTAAEIIRANPRLVMLSTDHVNSGDVTKMAAASDTLRALRDAGNEVPILLEGVVPSAYPETILLDEGPDFVCQGEAYEPIVQLVGFLRANEDGEIEANQIPGVWARYGDRIVRSSAAKRFADMPHFPFAAWDLMPPSQYRAHHWHCFDCLDRRTPYASLFTNLGCPYGCTFCSVNVVAGGSNFRPRRVDDVLAEIDLLVKQYGVRNLRILDNVFTIRLDLVEQLCDRILERGYDLNMWAYARVETIRNADILKKMKKAGVNWLAYGIEAASDRVREAVSKSSDMPTIQRAIEWTREAGISIVGNFIFGLPEDDLETMQMSLDMAKEYNFEFANFYCAMAYPGTALYDEMKAAGVPLPKSWSGYGQYAPDAMPLPSKYVSSKDILAFRDRAFKEYFSSPRHLDMLEKKFGPPAAAFVRHILTHDVKRK